MMAITVLVLVMLLLLQIDYGFGDLFWSKDCGENWGAYSFDHDQELFYINGNVVGKDIFCKTLQLYMENGCVAKYYFGSTSCGLGISFGMEYLSLWLFIEYTLAKNFIFLDFYLGQ